MKTREKDNGPELQFELKYCERCGSLWLRPTGGGQIYCGGCWREIKRLPAASAEADTARTRRRPGRSGKSEEEDSYDEGLDRDAAGGLA
jgi:hypothetical protein